MNITGDVPGTTNYTVQCDERLSVANLTAPQFTPYQGANWRFYRWVIGSTNQPIGQNTIQVPMTADCTVTAKYESRKLTVSANTAGSIDIGGDLPGTTNYTRACTQGQAVNLSAPASAASGGASLPFLRWTLDGMGQPVGQTSLQATITGSHVAVCSYGLEGDANNDCLINILDLVFVRNGLGMSVDSDNNWWADVNGDGKVNILDIIFTRSRLGRRCPAGP